MRIALVDLASTDGFVSKDTVAGGYGSRLRPFTRGTRIICSLEKRMHEVPSVQLGYIAALRAIIAECRRLGVVTAAFYVIGFLQGDSSSIGATIEYAIDLGSTAAQFKLLTPDPGTPMWKQLGARVSESDWERFDGYTPTFTHPSLTAEELRFLLGAAYPRFCVRPSWLSAYGRLPARGHMMQPLDDRVSAVHDRKERAMMLRAVTC